MQRESLLLIRVRAADPAWLCFLHLSLCTPQSIKASLKNKVMDQFHESLVPPYQFFLSLSFSLSLPLFFRLIPWNTESLCVQFSAWASKTHARGSPRRGTLHYSSGRLWPTRTEQVCCLETLLAFCVNQGISVSFLLYFFTTLFFSNLSLNF